MTTTISISLNIPQGYGIAKLTQQLTEYAQRLIAEEPPLQDEAERIVLSQEMVSDAMCAEKDYREGKCVAMDGLKERVARWL